MLRLWFADGAARTAEPPVLGAYAREIKTEYGKIIPRHENALGRLHAVHAPLGIPFADRERDGIGLGMPVALPRDPAADEALEFREAWYRAACLADGNLIPSPDERSVLIPRGQAGALRIHRLDLASGAPAMSHPLVRDAAWSPDSRWVVTRQADSFASKDHDGHDVALTLWDGRDWNPWATTYTELESGITVGRDGIWLARSDGAWRIDWPSGETSAKEPAAGAASDKDSGGTTHEQLSLEPRRVFAWPSDLRYQPRPAGRWITPSPDGSRFTFACLGGTCLLDGAGAPIAVMGNVGAGVDSRNTVWRGDGRRLAILENDLGSRPPLDEPLWYDRDMPTSRMRIVDSEGQVLRTISIPSAGLTSSPPRWTADGRWILFTSCPRDGRRIVAVDAGSGAAVDLSQPGWDAWAALLPKSGDVLLHNGRGGLWRSKLTVVQPVPGSEP